VCLFKSRDRIDLVKWEHGKVRLQIEWVNIPSYA